MNRDARRRHPDGTPYTPEEAMAAVDAEQARQHSIHISHLLSHGGAQCVHRFLQPVQPGQHIDRYGRLIWDDHWMPEVGRGRH